jgi:hypothetical protein
MQVGLTCQRADYNSHYTQFPQAAYCRVFAGPGDGLPAWPALPDGVTPWLSWKDQIPVERVAAWISTFPGPAKLTWNHEADAKAGKGGLTLAQYRDGWRALSDGLAGHPRRASFELVPIQTLQATVAKLGSDWRTWWAGVGDACAMDCYADSWTGKYPDPAGFLRVPLQLAEGTGRRLYLPELGAIRMPGDASGAGRASWIGDVVALLREHDCAGVAWWCAPGAGGRDFHLADQASAAAWRRVIGD